LELVKNLIEMLTNLAKSISDWEADWTTTTYYNGIPNSTKPTTGGKWTGFKSAESLHTVGSCVGCMTIFRLLLLP